MEYELIWFEKTKKQSEKLRIFQRLFRRGAHWFGPATALQVFYEAADRAYGAV